MCDFASNLFTRRIKLRAIPENGAFDRFFAVSIP
jgi:hypothetical protein